MHDTMTTPDRVPARDNSLFRNISPELRDELLEAATVVEIQAGDLIFEERGIGDSCYLVESGIVRISKGGESAIQETLGFIEAGDFFGELALFHRAPRVARASAAVETRLVRLRAEDFESLRSAASVELATAIATAGARHLSAVHTAILQQLQDSDRYREIGMALSDIAHHLRSPLCTVVTTANLLLDFQHEGLLTTEVMIKHLKGIERTAKAGIDFADSLLAQLRGEQRSIPARVPAIEVIERLVVDVAGIVTKGAAELRLAKSTDAFINCYVEDLLPALVNIVRNAVEALPESGGHVTVSATQEGPSVVFEITDNGRGIPRHLQHRIFERRFTHGKKGGTGLGLDHTRRVIEQHRGRINFRSEEGAGTTFRIWLPVAEPAPPVAGEVMATDAETDASQPGTPEATAAPRGHRLPASE